MRCGVFFLELLMSDTWSGNAKLQGLTTQLHLTGHEYNIALVC